jgi:hypothetical protein
VSVFGSTPAGSSTALQARWGPGWTDTATVVEAPVGSVLLHAASAAAATIADTTAGVHRAAERAIGPVSLCGLGRTYVAS